MKVKGELSLLSRANLPKDWKVVPLRYAVDFRSDQLSSSTAPNYHFRYVDIGSVSHEEGISNYTEMTYSKSPSRARKLVSAGDTIISMVRTYLRSIATIYNDRDVIVSTGFSVLRPRLFEPDYLGYLAKSDIVCSEIERRSWGVAYPAVGENHIGLIRVPLPPLDEQAKISVRLNNVTASIGRAIDLLQQELDTLEQLKKSIIHEAVTKGLDPTASMKPSRVEWIGDIPDHWRTTRIKYIAPAWNGLTYDPADVSDTGTPVLRSGNIQNGELDLQNLVRVDGFIPEKSFARSGDILICSRNGSRKLIGKNTLIHEDGYAFGAFMMIARPTVNSQYFYYLLNSGMFDFYLPTYLTSTVNQLTGTNFGNMIVPIADDPDEQLAIVEELNTKCKALDVAMEKKCTQLSLLRKQRDSLIFEYVTGKRRVNEVA